MTASAGRAAHPIARSAPLIAALTVFLFTSVAMATPPETRDPDSHFFTLTFGDLREEAEQGREEGKLGMLLFFKADACPYCQHMLQKVLNRPAVQDWYRERFVSIAIDIHGDVEVTDFDGITLPMKVFAEHRKVFMTPVTSFVDHNGAEIYRHLGMSKRPEEFLLLGKYIEGRHYFDREFKVFAAQQGMSEEDAVLVTPAGDTQ